MHSIINIGILLFLVIAIVNVHGDSTIGGSTTAANGLAKSDNNTCDLNEEYDECGSVCPPSCCDLFYPKPKRTCSDQCIPGCFCKTGFYRARNGQCVQPDACCRGKNEQFTKCGTACPETCDYKPQACVKICVAGCFCNKEYIRTDNSTNSPCIKKDQCSR